MGGTGQARIAVWALVCLLWVPSAAAQAPPAEGGTPPPAPAAEVPAPVAIPVAEVLPRAEAALVRLRELGAVANPDPAVQDIAAKIEPLREELIAQAFDTRRRLESIQSIDAVRSLDLSWRRRSEQLVEWAASVSGRASALETAYAETSLLRETWRVTEAAARKLGDAPQAVLARIDELQAAITKARKPLAAERASVLELQGEISRELERSEDVQQEIGKSRAGLERDLLIRDSPPLWTALGEAQEREPVSTALARACTERMDELRAAWPFAPGVLFKVLLMAAASLWLVLSFRQRAARLAAEDPSFEPTARVFDRPYSVAIVLFIIGLRLAWGEIPGLVDEALQTVVLIPALRLLEQVLGPHARKLVLALALFYVVDRARALVETEPLVDRLVLALEMVAACGVLGWLLRPARVAELPAGSGRFALVGRGLWLALALCGFAFVANLIGYWRLASVLGDATIRTLFFGVAFFAAYRVSDGIIAAARRAWPLNLFRALRPRPFSAYQRVRGVLRIAALVGWAFTALELFTVRDEVVGAVGAVLGAKLEVGELSLSLGDVLAFGFTIWAAVLVSRAIRALLEEDLFPRMHLPRGVPNAISATVQYGAVLLAFFLALAVVGINLTQITILAGAFGVGIGFGMQNIVNGFVSGLILLYERPVQVGDTVELGNVQGKMRRIGIRSSTLRTFEGADVIVPNASLISDRVVNWTLSDRLRRIDIDVGVEYGNEPQRVLDLLLDVAKAHPAILPDPAPMALFKRFGPSALDFQLRAWTENLDDAASIRSELGVAISSALGAARIGIPFPTYDVRIHSSRDQSSRS
jgi:small-conductance mechanosensitive channel